MIVREPEFQGIVTMPKAEIIGPRRMKIETWSAPVEGPKEMNDAEVADFFSRLEYAEGVKRMMRVRYRTKTSKPDVFDELRRRATEFYSEYEEINRRYVPEDPVFSKVVQGVALSTTNDTWEMGAASAGQSRVLEHFIGSEGTTSAAMRTTISRVSSQGTGTAPTAYTPEKFNSRSPAAAGTYYGALTAQVAWGTAQATLAANSLVVHSGNALGLADRWIAQPGDEIYLVNAEFCSHRSLSGTNVCSLMAIVEEL